MQKTKPILLLIITLFLSSCKKPSSSTSNALEQWVGSEVTVYFKRDLLGASGTPIGPTTTWLNNTKVSLDGKIITVHNDGIFFDSHYKMNSGDADLRHSVFWIPNDSILTIGSKK
ncbi:MAG: hypothetical protein ACSHX6_11710 [Akkermansiaceae bacterium]